MVTASDGRSTPTTQTNIRNVMKLVPSLDELDAEIRAPKASNPMSVKKLKSEKNQYSDLVARPSKTAYFENTDFIAAPKVIPEYVSARETCAGGT
jgi:hypothetical protein